jgi:hypothetical protein
VGLSIVQNLDKHCLATLVAKPIFPLDTITVRNGAEIRFEVLEDNADQLKTIVGEHRHFVIDGTTLWAWLKCLEPCVSSHSDLALLRHKPSLRGVLVVVEEPGTRQ